MSNYQIPISEAKVLTKRYRDTEGAEAIRAFKFERAAITELFAQDNVEGIRIYLGKEPDGSLQAIMVATNNEGNDITAVVVNHCMRCPTICDLNSGL